MSNVQQCRDSCRTSRISVEHVETLGEGVHASILASRNGMLKRVPNEACAEDIKTLAEHVDACVAPVLHLELAPFDSIYPSGTRTWCTQACCTHSPCSACICFSSTHAYGLAAHMQRHAQQVFRHCRIHVDASVLRHLLNMSMQAFCMSMHLFCIDNTTLP